MKTNTWSLVTIIFLIILFLVESTRLRLKIQEIEEGEVNSEIILPPTKLKNKALKRRPLYGYEIDVNGYLDIAHDRAAVYCVHKNNHERLSEEVKNYNWFCVHPGQTSPENWHLEEKEFIRVYNPDNSTYRDISIESFKKLVK